MTCMKPSGMNSGMFDRLQQTTGNALKKWFLNEPVDPKIVTNRLVSDLFAPYDMYKRQVLYGASPVTGMGIIIVCHKPDTAPYAEIHASGEVAVEYLDLVSNHRITLAPTNEGTGDTHRSSLTVWPLPGTELHIAPTEAIIDEKQSHAAIGRIILSAA